MSHITTISTLVEALAVDCTIFSAPAMAGQTINIPNKGSHCVDDPNSHKRWHHHIKPVATAKQGDKHNHDTRDPYADARRVPGFADYWQAVLPGSGHFDAHGERCAVICLYWLDAEARTIRCDRLASPSLPTD